MRWRMYLQLKEEVFFVGNDLVTLDSGATSQAAQGLNDLDVDGVEDAADLLEEIGAAAPVQLSPTALEDIALVRKVQNGDIAAFESLFHKYKAVIYRTALAITRDAGVAEEVLQDCFYRTYINIQRIHGDMPLAPWLHRVTINLSCNALKKRRYWVEPLENLREKLFSDPYHSPEHVFEQQELQGTMRDVINELPLKHRVVIVLHYLQDFSLPEIAEILNCPVGTVKSRLHYARKVLKTELERRELAAQQDNGSERALRPRQA